jgi:uncharacterized membrane protein YidH (DUF202 family)
MRGDRDSEQRRAAANERLAWIIGAVALGIFLLSLWKFRPF